VNDPRSHSKARRIHREVVKGKLCFWGCGRPATHADDLVPVSKGGDTKDRRNLVPACAHCNQSRGNRAAPKPMVASSRSVFSTQRNHIPASCRFSLPMRRYATIRGDFTAKGSE